MLESKLTTDQMFELLKPHLNIRDDLKAKIVTYGDITQLRDEIQPIVDRILFQIEDRNARENINK